MRYLARSPKRRIALEFFADSVSPAQRFTLNALNNAIARYASLLHKSGIRRGDRVALCLPSSPELLIALFGNHLLGVVSVPINPAGASDEFLYALRKAGISALVGEWDVPFRLKLQLRPPDFWEALQTSIVDFPQNHDLEAPALLCFTSGTTARPKAAVLTHRNLRSNLADLIRVWHWKSRDRLLLALPLFHVHGLGVGLHGWALSRCSLVLTRKFDPEQVLSLLDRRCCTLFMGVPTMYQRMVDAFDPARHHLLSLRLAISGSAPMSLELHRQCARAFGKTILERYGMTETMMNTSNPLRKRKPGSVGLSLPSVRIRLVDEKLREIRKPETPGEVWVKGPNVFAGYWRDAKSSRRALVNGWFRTGDVGYRDADGYHYLLGRLKLDIIKSAGYRIGAREIEEVLLKHPAVREAAVIGLPDRDLGEKIAAFVVADRCASDGDLQAHCRQFLAPYKCPRTIVRLEALPKNSLGKIVKATLKVLRPT